MGLTQEEFKWLYDAMKKVDFLSALSIGELENLSKKMFKQNYQKKTVIFDQGDEGDFFYISYKGVLSVWAGKEGEDKKRVALLKPGQYFGEIALLYGFTRDSRITADTDAELFLLDKEDFNALINQNPSLESRMHEIINKRMNERSAKIQQGAGGFLSKLFGKKR
jgi:trk system potassium uptake protein TrkA